MKKTSTYNLSNPIAVNLSGLQELLNCGRDTALKVAADSGARIKQGRRTLYSVDIIRDYINRTAS